MIIVMGLKGTGFGFGFGPLIKYGFGFGFGSSQKIRFGFGFGSVLDPGFGFGFGTEPGLYLRVGRRTAHISFQESVSESCSHSYAYASLN